MYEPRFHVSPPSLKVFRTAKGRDLNIDREDLRAEERSGAVSRWEAVDPVAAGRPDQAVAAARAGRLGAVCFDRVNASSAAFNSSWVLSPCSGKTAIPTDSVTGPSC